MTISNEKLQEIVQKDFMDAIFDGDLKRVKLLLAAGINPDKLNVNDTEGEFTPLMHAACQMDFKIVEALLQAGARTDLILIDGDLRQSIFDLLDGTTDAKLKDHNSKGMVEAMKTLISSYVITLNFAKLRNAA